MEMAKPTFLAKARITTHRDGYVTELRDDGRQFIWYPPPLRHVVTFIVAPSCPTCGRALVSATVVEAMAI